MQSSFSKLEYGAGKRRTRRDRFLMPAVVALEFGPGAFAPFA